MPILFTVCVLVIILNVVLRRKTPSTDNDFWEREKEADRTAKKSLDEVAFITIDRDLYEDVDDLGNSRMRDALDELKYLSGEEIANMTGYTNTDLKLKYGAANLPRLTRCDANYTALARSLDTLTQGYAHEKMNEQARKYALFAVSTGTDVAATWRYLVSEYKKTGDVAGLEKLKEAAAELNSASKGRIVRIVSGEE
ncbi:MAG: hypothetical protein K6E33_01610 [Lachnospiraceae bacterium]|nr:hypothetical protein [Lachnospiraceae bacterium]